ncbi:MAG: 3-(cis-5,6-dihydroxycyclohexa-1,3-dien-1-yl)propanoate dehydrogenase [Quisquiliibacterium sp.]
MRLQDQVILVTGGASGLGRAIVERMIEEGAGVCVLDRSEARLAQLKASLGNGVIGVPGDVRRLVDNQRAVQACVEHFGRLDCAVGNAGIWDFNTQLLDLPEARIDQAFDEVFQVNVKGYLLLAKAALEALVVSRGSLIYTLSNAGFYPDGGGPLYTASKHAVVGLVKQLAFELAPHVRVNGVAPGGISTDLRGPESLGMAQRSISTIDLNKTAPERVPIGMVPQARDYAAAYVFFASRQEHIPATGSILNYDGGFGIRGLRQTAGGRELPQRIDQTKP